MADNNIELMDIVVQGPYDDFTGTIVESYLKLPFVNNIIISCWGGNVVTKGIFDNSRVSVICS